MRALCNPTDRSLPGSLSMEFSRQEYSVVSDSLRPHGLYSPWNSPGQNTGVGSLSLLQGPHPRELRAFFFTFTFHFHALEKEMATHSSVLAWRLPGMGHPPALLGLAFWGRFQAPFPVVGPSSALR